MYQDKALLVSDGQALTGTAASTDLIDLGAARDLFRGEPLFLCVSITAMGGTSPTINVGIQTDDNSGFGSALTLVTSGTLTSPGVGYMFVLMVPPQATPERYLRAYFTLGGTSPTFSVDAWFTNQAPQAWVAAADAL